MKSNKGGGDPVPTPLTNFFDQQEWFVIAKSQNELKVSDNEFIDC